MRDLVIADVITSENIMLSSVIPESKRKHFVWRGEGSGEIKKWHFPIITVL